MEHLNWLLKEMIIGIGANISESAIVQSNKSLDGIKTVCETLTSQLAFMLILYIVPQNLQRTKNL
jgi:hypothetical protein